MSKINTGYCEIVSPIGDCEFKLKEEPKLALSVAGDLVMEIVESAMDLSEHKQSYKDKSHLKSCALDKNVSELGITNLEEACKLKKNKKILSEQSECPFKGVGDQLRNAKEVLMEEKKPRHPIVEKKSRLTDLMKNSKQMIAKYILNENIRHDNKEEEEKETVIKVIEAEPSICDMGASTSSAMFGSASDEEPMQEVKLGDHSEDPDDVINKTNTFPKTTSSKHNSLSNRYRSLKMSAVELKNKKWNIGKFMNILKKNKTKNDADTTDDLNTSTEQNKEKK